MMFAQFKVTGSGQHLSARGARADSEDSGRSVEGVFKLMVPTYSYLSFNLHAVVQTKAH